jgi:hypothetical protein
VSSIQLLIVLSCALRPIPAAKRVNRQMAEWPSRRGAGKR